MIIKIFKKIIKKKMIYYQGYNKLMMEAALVMKIMNLKIKNKELVLLNNFFLVSKNKRKINNKIQIWMKWIDKVKITWVVKIIKIKIFSKIKIKILIILSIKFMIVYQILIII